MPRFRCVTLEICGSKYILIDDKDSITFLDPQSLQKVKSLPLHDGQYLYSAYYHEQKNMVYAAFDNKEYWGIEIDKMIIKTRGFHPQACFKFVAYDEKHLIFACESSTLIIFNTEIN
jgi:hypothetical protein